MQAALSSLGYFGIFPVVSVVLWFLAFYTSSKIQILFMANHYTKIVRYDASTPKQVEQKTKTTTSRNRLIP